MLKPSLNDIVEKIDNRYYLIATVSKRARELVNKEDALIDIDEKAKPVVKASEEVIAGKVGYRLLTDDEIEAKELAHKLAQEKKLLEQD